MKDWNWNSILVWLFLVVLLVVVPAVMVGEGWTMGKSQEYTGLPQLEVFLNEVTLSEIKNNNKETKYYNNDVVLTQKFRKTKFNNVEIKGRGNSTWTQEKKPLQLKFAHKVDLLGLGQRRKWILLANYFDNSNLKTDIAFYLERMLGEKYAYSGEFVDFYINDKYEGLYYLTRGIEIGKNAVGLKDPLGILVELDNVYGKLEEKYYTSSNGEIFTVKDILAHDNTDIAMEDFLQNFNALELAIKEHDYANIEKLIDIVSFAQYYLISEFTANIDAYFTSVYFYKDGLGDKIHAGPAWDFDRTFTTGAVAVDADLTRRADANEYFAPDEQYWEWSKLYSRLIEFPEFERAVEIIYKEKMSGKKDELMEYINKKASEIEKSATMDSARWEKEDYHKDTDEILKWVDARYDYLEKKYGEKSELHDESKDDILVSISL